MPDDSDNKALIQDVSGLGKVADSKLVNKAYDDTLAPLMKQLGSFGEDIAKTGRLILAPFQLLAAAQDRFAGWVQRIAENVSEERRQEPPPEIAVPVLRALAYLPEENLLADLYLELLTRAVDRERADEAHPAFIRIIEQLSPDEVCVLERLRKGAVRLSGQSHDFGIPVRISAHNALIPDDFGPRGLQYPRRGSIYLDHLQSLDLVCFGDVKQPTFELTDWGRMFVSACVPSHLSGRVGTG